MGHDTENLIGEDDLEEFSGIILSPVNRTPDKLFANIPKFRDQGDYDIILDPQLYFPKSQRGSIRKHPYFPSDFDTSDHSSLPWWNGINKELVDYATSLEVNKICSPVIIPREYNENYYNVSVLVCNDLININKDNRIDISMTFIVNMPQLADPDNIMRFSSIITKANTDFIYLVVDNNVAPRSEFTNVEELTGLLFLINLLEINGKVVLVAYSSSDMILFKSAGASHCATNKYFNLRRFTKTRFEEQSGGGGQLEYWFEHNLLAFIRDSDVRRLSKRGFADLLGGEFSGNSWAQIILDKFKEKGEVKWRRESWRQFLSWFAKTENFIDNNGNEIIDSWLRNAQNNWNRLKENSLLMVEDYNDGRWVRPWTIALAEFKDFNK